MSLICAVIYDTEENRRTEITKQFLSSLRETVNWDKHRLIIVDNASCDDTKQLFHDISFDTPMPKWTVIFSDANIGTSRALNLALQQRQPNEHFIKIDPDIIIHQSGWVEQMEAAINRDPFIGIVGLKRKDLIQSTWHPDPNYKSELIMLPHQPGERWICVERTADIIGSCTMFNSELLNKVGYSWQPGLYGYEDVLMSHRSHLAGFYNCFLNHIEIDHLDNGEPNYQRWKETHSGEYTQAMKDRFMRYVNGDIYEPFY